MAGGIKTLGNHGVAYLLTKGTVIEGDGEKKALKGNWYYIAAMAESGSGIPAGLKVGLPFLASADKVLVEGDNVIPLTASMLGFARGKSLSQSKSTVDATTDSNEGIAQNLSDGVVATTGSISGLNEIPVPGSAQEQIIQMFQTYIRDNAGVITVTEVSTPTSLLMIDWTARRIRASGPQDGDLCEIDIMPVIFTSKNTDSDYASVKSFNCDFVAQASDDDGCKMAHWVGKYVLPVTPSGE